MPSSPKSRLYWRSGEDLTLHVLYRIMDAIDDLLLPYTFDLSIFRYISDPDLVEHIERVGVVFYESGTPSVAPPDYVAQ